MSPVSPRLLPETVVVFSEMQRAARGVWETFLAQLDDDSLTAEDAWLLLQFVQGATSSQEATAALGLMIDVPEQAIARGIARGWIARAEDSQDLAITAIGMALVRQLQPVAQNFNQLWREEILARGVPREQLDLVLTMLQGKSAAAL